MKYTYSKIAFITGLCLCFVGIFYKIYPIAPTVIINNKTFFIEVAVTENEKQIGLGNRRSLGINKGMVFPYDRKDFFPFWMKGMNFPLDFLWIDGNVIVDITKNVPIMTGTAITTVRPSKPVDKILEFNAGFVDSNGINIGDIVQFKN